MKVLDKPVVVMADDDEDDCLLARDAFKQSGSPGVFQCVEDGTKLLDLLSKSHTLPALILLDLNMPRKDGRQILKEMKDTCRFKNIPVVVFTTSREEKDMTLCREIGANSFVTKPVLFDDWVRIMRSLADKWLTC
ncbi:Response regulator receiver protein [uncultured Desulfobacterium sp.]|uniref:Response regulator receiver protein n=1 Tax=uncultured Desulfobacterium sp. TaxID=201089 RepID=A0A445MR61_9BACT|nr:Response regulator receiver protein [uncultured Desulfobacterium sp.]